MQPENNIGRVRPKVKSDLNGLPAGKGDSGMEYLTLGITVLLGNLIAHVIVRAIERRARESKRDKKRH